LRSYALPKREVKAILNQLGATWPPEALPQEAKQVQAIEVDEKGMILITGGAVAVRMGNKILPSLREKTLPYFPSVTVDPGAVRFICNGADVMRRGITEMTKFPQGAVVAVKEKTYGKFIAVGEALTDSEAAEKASSGPVVKNFHYVSDKFWEALKEKLGGT